MVSKDHYTKKKHMKELSAYRRQLYTSPQLRSLFLELTSQCNEHCLHCGSSCDYDDSADCLTKEEILTFLEKISGEFDLKRLRLCITGGEPLLRKDFFEIMEGARDLGFRWGMTSNGTLISKETAVRLADAGMSTISVSVDGLEENHNWFRQTKDGYERALRGLEALVAEKRLIHVQATTVVNRRNLKELPELYEVLKKTGIRSWRIINMEPIGRARDHEDLMLRPEDYREMFAFILDHHHDPVLPTVYGCSHYLGTDLEYETRKWYFMCVAGLYVASIMSNGDIGACLDIERRPELIQGNIKTDDFKEVWENRFEVFRSDMRKTGPCKHCKEFSRCNGDSFHTWNFDENRPNLCMKGIMF